MAVKQKRRETELTVADCDAQLERYRRDLGELVASDDDPEALAVCRYQIDRWLDRRLLLTSPSEEWAA